VAEQLRNFKGMSKVSELLQGLPKDVRREVLPYAVTEAAQPVVKWAKRFAKRSERTGALRESIGFVTRNYQTSAKSVAIVGPQRGYYRKRKRLKFGAYVTKEDLRGAESPSHYAHLVEFGHHIAVGGSLRPEYNKELVGIGKFSKNGKELKRWKRSTIKTRAKGQAVGFVAAKPFIRPAAAMSQAESAAAFDAGAVKGIERVRAKYIRSGKHAA
jgi:hypothetical protein